MGALLSEAEFWVSGFLSRLPWWNEQMWALGVLLG